MLKIHKASIVGTCAALGSIVCGSAGWSAEPTLNERQAAYDGLKAEYTIAQTFIDAGVCTAIMTSHRTGLEAIAKKADIPVAGLRLAAADANTEQKRSLLTMLEGVAKGDPRQRELAGFLCQGYAVRAERGLVPKAFRPFSDVWQAAEKARTDKQSTDIAKLRAELPPFYAKAYADIEAGTMTVARMRDLGSLDVLLEQCATADESKASHRTTFLTTFSATQNSPLNEKLSAAFTAGSYSVGKQVLAAVKLSDRGKAKAKATMCAAAAKKYPDFKMTGWQAN